MTHYDVIVIGAGAAGLMCAITAGQRGRKVLLIEHTDKIGEKIRISGGGRCNFTNINAKKNNYLSQNPHFVVSALSTYTPQHFIDLIESYRIDYHEKTLGQLFCDGSAKQIISMLLDLCEKNQVSVLKNCSVKDISKEGQFTLKTNQGVFNADSVVIATGGLSIPQIGASDFGYRIAKKFNLKLVPVKPALVPLTVAESQLGLCFNLKGVSVMSVVTYNNISFKENILFTHQGLSGPAILQISSYLRDLSSSKISINLLPDIDLAKQFLVDKNIKKTPINYLKQFLTNRLVDHLLLDEAFQRPITEVKKDTLLKLAQHIHNFEVHIEGSEGYKKAEVTVGGVDTDELSSKTMMAKNVPGLFFIGEVVDVTGWLGGYNFQWAWASGYAAGSYC